MAKRVGYESEQVVLFVAACLLARIDAIGINLDHTTLRPAAKHNIIRKLRQGYGDAAWRYSMEKDPVLLEISQVITESKERIGQENRSIGAEAVSMVSVRKSGICKVPLHAENVWGSILGAGKRICDSNSGELQEGEACETACAKWYKVPSPSKIQCICDTQGDACLLQPVTENVDESPRMITYLRCPVSPSRVGPICLFFCGFPAVLFALSNERNRRQRMTEKERATAATLHIFTPREGLYLFATVHAFAIAGSLFGARLFFGVRNPVSRSLFNTDALEFNANLVIDVFWIILYLVVFYASYSYYKIGIGEATRQAKLNGAIAKTGIVLTVACYTAFLGVQKILLYLIGLSDAILAILFFIDYAKSPDIVQDGNNN